MTTEPLTQEELAQFVEVCGTVFLNSFSERERAIVVHVARGFTRNWKADLLKADARLAALQQEFDEYRAVSINEYHMLKDSLKAQVAALTEELRVTDEILKGRESVLAAIPECPVHGSCVPHALEWIKGAEQAESRLAEMMGDEDYWC